MLSSRSVHHSWGSPASRMVLPSLPLASRPARNAATGLDRRPLPRHTSTPARRHRRVRLVQSSHDLDQDPCQPESQRLLRNDLVRPSRMATAAALLVVTPMAAVAQSKRSGRGVNSQRHRFKDRNHRTVRSLPREESHAPAAETTGDCRVPNCGPASHGRSYSPWCVRRAGFEVSMTTDGTLISDHVGFVDRTTEECEIRPVDSPGGGIRFEFCTIR